MRWPMRRRSKLRDRGFGILKAVLATGVAWLALSELPSLVRYVKMEKM